MLRIVLALLLLPGVAFGQSAGGGGAMTRAEIETALQHSLRDSLTTTSIDLETVADTITMTAAGGSATLTGDVTDVTFWFTGIAGQTEPNACAIESGGETLCLTQRATWSVLEASVGNLYLDAPSTIYGQIGSSTRLQVNSAGVCSSAGGSALACLLSENASFTNPNVIVNAGDLDTGMGLGAVDMLSLIAGGWEGIRIVEDTVDYVETNGCRDYGTLTAAPTPNGACDEYYDDSGAKCFYNGATWDKIGAGTCV